MDHFSEVGESYTVEEVLSKFNAGPQTGVFTDGSARPNPGPGGWGLVHVVEGKIVQQKYGACPQTTNNRMELTALIEACKMLPPDAAVTVYTDSELCVNTFTKWAPAWEKKGWKRKTGPIANLELVQELYYLLKERPGVQLEWIEAHNGWRWNEYADSLSTAWSRPVL
jgi:ribonuclease HI